MTYQEKLDGVLKGLDQANKKRAGDLIGETTRLAVKAGIPKPEVPNLLATLESNGLLQRGEPHFDGQGRVSIVGQIDGPSAAGRRRIKDIG